MNAMRKMLLIGGFFVWAVPSVLACPFCQEALLAPGQAAAQSATWRAYVFSIATLIAVPALLVGGLVTWVVCAARVHRRERTAVR